jgi:hypothetical protein
MTPIPFVPLITMLPSCFSRCGHGRRPGHIRVGNHSPPEMLHYVKQPDRAIGLLGMLISLVAAAEWIAHDGYIAPRTRLGKHVTLCDYAVTIDNTTVQRIKDEVRFSSQSWSLSFVLRCGRLRSLFGIALKN